jgi:hypothetical protein
VLPAEVIAQAKRDLDERTYRQEYLASFEEAVGRVYYAFDRRHDVHDFSLPEGIGTSAIPWCGGMDFNVNPMTAVWGWEKEIRAADGVMEKHAFIWDVFAIPNADTAVAARTIKERVEEVSYGGAMGSFIMHPDPSGAARHTASAAGATDHTILRDHGFRLSFRSAAPKRRDRWNATNAMFCNAASRRRTHVHPRCTRLIRDLEGVIYREGTSEPDEAKCGQMVHVCDSLGYWFELRHMVGAGSGPGSFDPRAVFTN